MGDTTKKQHYVWRKYLVPWTDTKDLNKGKIYVLRKKLKGTQEKIECRELMKIGFENYFYDISEFTPKDVSVYSQFISYFQKNNPFKWELNLEEVSVANQQKDFIEKEIMCSFEKIDNEFQFLSKLANKEIDFYKDSAVTDALKKLKMAVIDSIFSGEQVMSEEEALSTFAKAMENLGKDDLKYEFNLFLCTQYFRSPRIHQNLNNSFEEFKKLSAEFVDLNNKFYVNLITLLFGQIMAQNITENHNTSLLLMDNKSSIPFITGDTPIINISDKEEITIFHYPISPTIAVQVIISRIPLENVVMTIDEELKVVVKGLNQKLFNNCSNEVYAHNREVLNQYLSK